MSYAEINIDTKGKTTGQIKTRCPKCEDKTSLSVNLDEGVWQCHKAKCGWKGSLPKVTEKRQYIKPMWRNNTQLSDKAVKWFLNRGISQRTLIEMKVTEGLEYMPQTGKEENTIQFNYFRGEELINTKFRDANKNFKMVSNAELIFYNVNALEGNTSIICVEGEGDTLAYIESGLKNVISVPNGASKGSMKLDYLDSCWDKFEKIEKIYLATDNDEAGICLRNELARRLGAERCYIVDFGDVKDANEYLVKYGQAALELTIENAKPMPISGVVYVNDISDEIDTLYREGFKKGKTTGIDEFDKLTSFEVGFKTIITGVPSHGKSEFVDFLMCRLNLLHDWKFGIFSPENYPLSYHFSKLAEKFIGQRFNGQVRMSEQDKETAKLYINDNFFFIRPDNEEYTIDNILDRAKQLVLRYGISGLVIDPYNRLEHHMDKGMSETNYISKFLDKITTFCQRYGVHVFLVAHPTKMQKIPGTQNFEIPNLYSISGSSNWFAKADNGITVYRDVENNISIHVQKVKFKHWGERGSVEIKWDEENGRYYTYLRDNQKWITLNQQ